MASSYRRVEVVQSVKAFHETDPEGAYWARFRGDFHSQQPSSVTTLDWSPAAPHDLAVTASTRVAVLDARTLETRHLITKFRSAALSGRFRADGRLLCAGDEAGVVRVFDARSRAELRVLRGHGAAVRSVRFAADRVQLVSGGDDGAVRAWDLATGACVRCYAAAHREQVRSVEGSPATAGLWASASYDGTVRLWDLRAPAAEPALTLTHDAPVEAALFFPNGNALVSAAGSALFVWDLLGGGRVLAQVRNHQKAVTALALDPDGTRILSGGVDRLVKVYDVQSYRVLHTMSHHAPVLSLAMSPDRQRLALGAADGDLCVMTRVPDPDDDDYVEGAASSSGPDGDEYSHNKGGLGSGTASLRSLLRGGGTAGSTTTGSTPAEAEERARAEAEATARAARQMPQYDRMLRKFQYKAALDAALETTQPGVVVGLLQELIHRGGLLIALAGRDETTLEPLLVFLVNYCTAPQYTAFLTTVCTAVINMYASTLGRSVRVDELFFKLQTRLHREIDLQNELLRLMGALDMIVAAAEMPTADAAADEPDDPATAPIVDLEIDDDVPMDDGEKEDDGEKDTKGDDASSDE